MTERGVASPTWPWVVSAGLHTALLAALWGYSIATDRVGEGYDTPPQLWGSTSSPAVHRSSSLGDIADGEGYVCFEAAISSPVKQDVPPAPKADAAASASTWPERARSPAKVPEPTMAVDASAHATIAERQEASLPSHMMEKGKIAQEFASSAPLRHMPSRAKASVAALPEAQPSSAVLPRLPTMTAVASGLSAARAAGEPRDAEDAAGGRFIRREGHLGRDGSVGGDDSSPEPLVNRPPVYPETARRNHWGGTVVLRLWITELGHVQRVEAATSSGYGVLDEAAVAAVKAWQFRPALRGGKGVAITVLQPVVFDLQHTFAVSEDSTRVSK